MGVDCSCLAAGFAQLQGGDEAGRLSEQTQRMQQGATFMRPVALLLGLSSQPVFVRLSDDTSHLAWRTTKSWTGEERGQVDLTDEALSVRSCGEKGLQFSYKGSAAPLLEITAESSAVRDEWVVNLTELRSRWREGGARPASSVSAEGHSNRAEYFARREAELLERKKESEERKKKYSAGGMKHTAQIMLERG